jgi:hypothetical protein
MIATVDPIKSTRRETLVSLLLVPAVAQDPSDDKLHLPKTPGEEERLPNGKSQRNEIARQQHEEALKDVDNLLAAAEELRDELKRAGNYVVPVSSLRRTEEIEKLAKRIRGRLKS